MTETITGERTEEEGEQKCWFCPNCNNYPDRILEKYSSYREYREWKHDGHYSDYEVDDTEYGNSEMFCSECDGELEYRHQSTTRG